MQAFHVDFVKYLMNSQRKRPNSDPLTIVINLPFFNEEIFQVEIKRIEYIGKAINPNNKKLGPLNQFDFDLSMM